MQMRSIMNTVNAPRRCVLRELYQEAPGVTFTDDGVDYDLNMVLAAVDGFPLAFFQVRDLTWVFHYDDPDEDRVAAANLRFPVLVSYYKERFVVIDGLHRLAKAVETGAKVIRGKFVPEHILRDAMV